MIFTVTVALGVIVLGVRGALRFRDRQLAAKGCPTCGGRLTARGSVLGCHGCRTLWTTSGLELVLLRKVPVDLLPQPDDVPRAEVRQRDKT